MEENFKEIGEKLKFRKKFSEGLCKCLGNFTLNLEKVFRQTVEFQNKFRERLKVKTCEL